MARESTTKYIILGLLNHEPLTGYDIRKAVEYSIQNFWSEISYGQIYPTLKQLDKNGLVTKEVEVQENRPLRKVYSITPKGQEELQAWLEIPAEREVMKLEVLLKLFFGAQTTLETNIQTIQKFRSDKENYLKHLNMLKANLQEHLEEKEDHFFFLLTLLFGEYLTQAQLQWVDEVLRMLQERSENSSPAPIE